VAPDLIFQCITPPKTKTATARPNSDGGRSRSA
jgi:hypothetical protein